MLEQLLKEKRCLVVCGGGGVGKTTMSASLALAATQHRKRVLVVTIDPAKRLGEAFGVSIESIEQSKHPVLLDRRVLDALGVPADSTLSVGILNPKLILEEILEQVLTPTQAERLRHTVLYQQLSQMIYGLQEYTSYEWVTRLLQGTAQATAYDLIVLDTPPAFHAKDFFNAPEKISKLMESRVFQLFLPKKKGLFSFISFGWVEKLLGERVFRESVLFFELFATLRDRILERCEVLARFFSSSEVQVIAVATPDSSAVLELEGLVRFLETKKISVPVVVLNQCETSPEIAAEIRSISDSPEIQNLSPEEQNRFLEKIRNVHQLQIGRVNRANEVKQKLEMRYPSSAVRTVPAQYSSNGLDILKACANAL